ncbi:MAG TPA: PIN domain-containing protein [Bacteroidia bacterium]|nr:PIN domain-containing protein [Bacteroidia bacterium]
MKSLFLDTNVLIDFFADRKPYSTEAASLFNLAVRKELLIYISAVSYNNMYYIFRQSSSHADTLKILNKLCEWTEVVEVKKETILRSLKSEFKDFEDAIQYYCARSIPKMDFIVTRNTKDFKLSSLPVLTPKEAVSLLESASD